MGGNESTQTASDCRHKSMTNRNGKKWDNQVDDNQLLGSYRRSIHFPCCVWVYSKIVGKRPLSPTHRCVRLTPTWYVRTAMFATKRYRKFVLINNVISSLRSDFYEWVNQPSQTSFLIQNNISWKRIWFYLSIQTGSPTSCRHTDFLLVVTSSSWRQSSTSRRGDRR